MNTTHTAETIQAELATIAPQMIEAFDSSDWPRLTDLEFRRDELQLLATRIK